MPEWCRGDREPRSNSRWGSPEAVRSPPGERARSPEGWNGGLYSSFSMGQGLEGLLVTSPNAPQRTLKPLTTPFAARATEVDHSSLGSRGR